MILTLHTQPPVPLDLSGILPRTIGGLSERDVSALSLPLGRVVEPLGSFFHVDNRRDELLFRGDFTRCDHLARSLDTGTILVEGSVGHAAGARMSGGKLVIHGDTLGCAGASMTGGRLEIQGSTGERLGGPDGDSPHGMNGGAMLVHGNTGSDAAYRMRRGLIEVLGAVGPFAASSMIAGTLIVAGTVGRGLGAGLRRGSLFATSIPELPNWTFSGAIDLSFPRILQDHLQALGFPVPELLQRKTYRLFRGDRLASGLGELFVA